MVWEPPEAGNIPPAFPFDHEGTSPLLNGPRAVEQFRSQRKVTEGHETGVIGEFLLPCADSARMLCLLAQSLPCCSWEKVLPGVDAQFASVS